MFLAVFMWLLNVIVPCQFGGDNQEAPPEEAFQGPNLVLYVFAWIFLVIGIIALTVLVLYTKYGREISIKLSVLSITIASIFLGFSLHFFLLHFGL
ncbi:MAG: hypothetical protein R6U96_12375 [Promethearchaeia archaeon]